MPNGSLDAHGQPLNLHWNAARRIERDLSELLGLAKCMLIDGTIDAQEADFLRNWADNHPDALAHWPTDFIFARLNHFYADGHIDEAERRELKELLSALVGGTTTMVLGEECATTLPLDRPPPELLYRPTDVYVFTGKFAFGPRGECRKTVMQRGAQCEDNITKRTSFLVISTFDSRDWVQSSYGRKIQKAVNLRDTGLPLKIVGEDHWARAL